jgi:hypothetical protein
MVGPQQISFGEDTLCFALPRTLYFSLLSFNDCSLFLELCLTFIFALTFVQILLYLCIKVYLDHWSMLVFIKRVVSKRFEWCWKRKKFHAKSGTKGSLFRLRLRILHVMLDVVLIVCLVVFAVA